MDDLAGGGDSGVTEAVKNRALRARRVVTAAGEHLVRTALKDLLPQLDADAFWQVHRSAAVRADAIDTVRRDEAGRLQLTLRGTDETLTVSRLYAGRFKSL